MKDLKDLNLLDRFLFAEAMEDPEPQPDFARVRDLVCRPSQSNLISRAIPIM